MASKVTTRLALLLAPLVLAGCSDSVMKTIGLQRDPPDEFQVTTQPALAMPPDLNVAAQALPRPDPGASRPQDVAVRQQAEDAMIGGAAIGGGPTTGGDAALVQAAGPAAPADIREEVDAQGQKDKGSRKLSNRLNPLGRAAAPVAEVDPAGERQRLQENAALGRSPAAGQTPLVKPGNRGPLGNLLDSIF
jgi:Protein of unknown function (DUF3035)